MTGAVDPRLGDWLARPDVRAVDPERVDLLRAALDAPDPPVSVGRGGALTAYVPGPGRQRLVELDRYGHLVGAWRWSADGALAWAKCRTPADIWIGIEPTAEPHPVLGTADRLCRLDPAHAWAPGEVLTEFAALDWHRPEFIPPLLDPGRLPAGAGTAVLNLIAGLMKDRGVARVRYRGPYPTEQLFTALLESFRYDGGQDDPLGQFLDGGALDWLPAPHERHRPAEGVWVQRRHEIDKVVLDGVAFYRRDWQGVIRHEPRVVRHEPGRAVCSLWALGRPIEDRLVLDAAGDVQARPAAALDPSPPAPLPPVWRPALAELIARDSAPALAGSIREVMASLALEWGPVPGDLLTVDSARARFSRRLREEGAAWMEGAARGPARAQRAIVFALELARLLAPTVRLLAQSRLAALPADAQARALAADAPPAAGLPDSVGKLVALLASGRA
jgi:hypothetical protein